MKIAVFGIIPFTDLIKEGFIKLGHEISNNNPDLLMNKGVPKEVIEESKKKMRAINSAFDQIEKKKAG